MVLRGCASLLSTPGLVVVVVGLMELCFPPLLEAASKPNIAFHFKSIAGGVPGQDYPILSAVPDTGFSCAAQQFPGYYADTGPGAACQVFHVCQADGRHDSFLCPNGTLFSQQYLVCDWWYNVLCSTAKESGRTPSIFVSPLESDRVVSLSVESWVASGEEREIIRPPHHTFPSLTAKNSHQQTHGNLPSFPVTFTPPSISSTLFGDSQQPSHPSLPPATFSHTHRHHLSPLGTHKSITHSVTQSHDSDQQSILQSTLTHSQPTRHTLQQSTHRQSGNHSFPQSPVTHSQFDSHSFPKSTVASQPDGHSFPQSTVTHSQSDSHTFQMSIVTPHSQIPTLFREDVLRSLSSLDTQIPNYHSRQKPRPGRQPSVTYTFTSLQNDKHSGEQVNTTATSEKSFAYYSQESENLIAGIPTSRENERVEYDEVYSATLFPPNIPQLGDVYEAAKGNVVVKVATEPYDLPFSFQKGSVHILKSNEESYKVPPFPQSSTQKSIHSKTSPFVLKSPDRSKESAESSQLRSSYTLPRTQNSVSVHEDLTSAASPVKAIIIPSPEDPNPLYQSPHTSHKSFSDHSTTQTTLTTTHNLPSQRHEPSVPHYVWRPSQDPFVTSQHTSLAPDESLNFIISNPQPRDYFTATAEPFQVSSNQPSSHESFRVIHETKPPAGHRFATSQQDTFDASELRSVKYESFEALDHSLFNSHESLLLIETPSPAIHGGTSSPNHILFGDSSDSPKVFPGIGAAFEDQDHSHKSFAVHYASLPSQPLPIELHHH